MLELILFQGGDKLLSAWFLGLITLGIGYFVSIQGKKDPECCGKCSKIFGTIITVGALLGLICVGLQSYRHAACGKDKTGASCPYHDKNLTDDNTTGAQ